jgi:hypothetical protein
MMMPFRAVFVTKNPFWSLWNIQRDIRGAATKLPGATILKMLKYAAKSLPDAYKDVFQSYSTDLVREMYENKMLLVGRQYREKVAIDADTDFDRLMLSYSLSPVQYKTTVQRLWNKLAEALEKPGQFSERLVKIASYKFLKEQPDMGKKRAGHLVRTRGGSPDFYRRGGAFGLYNNLFMFSNAGKEGWRASIEALREKPMETSWKIAKYDILPKLAMYAASSGAVAWLGAQMGDDDLKAWGEHLQAMFQRIPEHDKTNYQTVPIGMTASGKTVYLVQPHDFTGQVIAGTFWKLLNSEDQSDIQGLFDFAAGGMPYESLTPHVSMALDVYNYLRGRNPRDPWRDRTMVSDLEWKAGGAVRAKAFGKAVWNRYGGRQIYSFPYDDLERIQDDIEKAINQPGLSGLFKRFLRVSDRGLYEELVQSTEMRDEERQQARTTLAKNKAIIDHLNQDVIASKDDARKLWLDLQKAGADAGRFSDFYNRYLKYVGKKKGEIVYNALEAAQSNRKRALILKKVLGEEVDEKDVTRRMKEMKREMVE